MTALNGFKTYVPPLDIPGSASLFYRFLSLAMCFLPPESLVWMMGNTSYWSERLDVWIDVWAPDGRLGICISGCFYG